jgi:hypothetical protein
MLIKNTVSCVLLISLVVLVAENSGFAQDGTAGTAENLMIWQLEAIKKGDYQRFIVNGNKAFKELMDRFLFDSFKQQQGSNLTKGYRLEYLDSIRRLGMREHLWKIHITGYKYELLGSLSLSHGKVVGFNLD